MFTVWAPSPPMLFFSHILPLLLCPGTHPPHNQGTRRIESDQTDEKSHLLALRFFRRASRSFSRVIFLQHCVQYMSSNSLLYTCLVLRGVCPALRGEESASVYRKSIVSDGHGVQIIIDGCGKRVGCDIFTLLFTKVTDVM